jgi:hypothetical protein
MESIEVLIWVLAVVGVVASNLYKAWRSKQKAGAPRVETAVPTASPTAPTPPAPAQGRGSWNEAAWGRGADEAQALPYATEVPLLPEAPPPEAPASALPATSADLPAATPPAPRHRGRRSLRFDTRQAVIGMTILGPCRALEPYEPPGT